MTPRGRAGDDGFTLLEVLVSLGIIGIVLTAVSTFFIRSMVITNLEGARQAAVQVAANSMEQLRSLPGSLAESWLAANAGPTATPMGSVTYTVRWNVSSEPENVLLVPKLIAATVKVNWPSTGCNANNCTYSATTWISTADVEPVFDPAALP